MDYKKKYKEALERAKSIYSLLKDSEDSKNYSYVESMEDIFPELKKSEAEQIRKALIHYFSEQNGILTAINGSVSVGDILAWLEKQGEPTDKGEISDGYHTFNELYYYRMLYNAAFFNMLPKEWVHKSKKHHDGEECFGGGWFIVMANLPTGQISNHYELKDWDLFKVPEKEIADKWDGHTPQEAAERLHKYLLEKQGEYKSDEWSEEDDDNIRMIEDSLSDYLDYISEDSTLRKYQKDSVKEKVIGYVNWLKSIKDRITPQPKQEWSEGDKENIEHCIRIFERDKNNWRKSCHLNAKEEIEYDSELQDWLRYLQPPYYCDDCKLKKSLNWKPSDEQMKALWDSIPENVKEISEREMLLDGLYQDLKKLREE